MEYIINRLNTDAAPHRHQDHEIIIFISGAGVFQTKYENIEATPGKIIIVPPGVRHHTEPKNGYPDRIYIRGDFKHFFGTISRIVVLDNSENDGVSLAKMIYNSRYSEHEYLSALVNAFIHYLLQSIKMYDDISLVLKYIIETITENFHNSDIDLNLILKKSGYSEDYIRSRFKDITGKTPTEFLTEIRISHACLLIDTYKNALTLSEVAEKCGYTDYVYFSKRFKGIMGVSPKKYMETN